MEWIYVRLSVADGRSCDKAIQEDVGSERVSADIHVRGIAREPH